MRFKIGVLCFFLGVDILFTYPVTENQDGAEEVDPEEIGGFFEGDMDLDYDQMSAILYPNRRNGLKYEKYRWPGNVIYYQIDSVFEKKHIEHIRLALDSIEQASCIKFLPRTKRTKNYILVKGEPTGCHSAIGYRENRQILNLHKNEIGYGCFILGKIMHEFIHALGFYHQQSASNRDDFVTILKENIKDGKQGNFLKEPPTLVTDFGVNYDYNSIMHYSRKAFSKNGKPTIIPREKDAQIGQRIALSEGDIKKLNAMYKCQGY